MTAEWLVLAVAVLTFGSSMLGYLQSRDNKRKIAEVHVLADGNLSKVTKLWEAQQKRSAQLGEALAGAGVTVPETPEPPAGGAAGGPALQGGLRNPS
jgi:hypothetical protein